MKFHHFGLIVSSIIDFEKKFIYEEKVAEVIDSLQNAKLSLYKNYSDSFIELIEPLSSKSFTWNHLNNVNSSPYHHFCYEVSDHSELNFIESKYRLLPILGPVPAKLFNDREVAFFYTRSKMIVEFLIH